MSERDYWQKQEPGKALFEDLIWSKPENKAQSGRLLIVGGNINGFSAPAQAYNSAEQAGIGVTHICLPDSLQKQLGNTLPEAIFCPSIKIGSFSKAALAEILENASWAELSLLAGNFGRNSETTIMLETFISKYKGPLCVTKDALDVLSINPNDLVNRPETVLVLSMSQLQKLTIKVSPKNLVRFSMGLIQLVEVLHELTLELPIAIVTKHQDNFLVALKGQVSSTKLDKEIKIWRIAVASFISVWWLQNKQKPFEAITTGIFDSLKS